VTLADLETIVRQDLNDTDATSYRWAAGILDRCIARAVKDYSLASPRLQPIILPVLAGVRAYPLPAPSTLAPPAAPVLTAAAGGGSLPAGTIYVKVTAAVGSTESAPSPEASVSVAANAAVSMQIATVAGAQAYNVYAAAAPGAETWNGRTDSARAGAYAITSLAAEPFRLPQPAASLQAWWIEEVEYPLGQWPRALAPFEEQGGLFVLSLPPARLGGDVMNVTYAAIHELDASGSTIPDQDTDAIALGAYGYACLQYGTPAADNFRFQDGEMRDALDDTMVPAAWRTLGNDALERFRERLEEIRRRREPQFGAVVRWP
jgi:hypothetical protein